MGGSSAALTAFSLTALTIVALMFALSLAVAIAQDVVVGMVETGGATVKRWGGRILIVVGLWLIVLALGANALARFFPVHPKAKGQAQMPGMGTPGDPTPPVKGFYEGQEVEFIHTEASDPRVAEMLTKMMGPKVLLVPSLNAIPVRLLAEVYVFSNGVRGRGPFGFQPDVFDAAPGDGRYTPLRRVNLVTWKEVTKSRVLRSSDEVLSARTKGEVTITRPGVVVIMPFLIWPGGRR